MKIKHKKGEFDFNEKYIEFKGKYISGELYPPDNNGYYEAKGFKGEFGYVDESGTLDIWIAEIDARLKYQQEILKELKLLKKHVKSTESKRKNIH